jgi:hypothetical protein
VFASDATVLLHEATVGAMRDLDRLATAALRETARKQRKLVERDVVVRISRPIPGSATDDFARPLALQRQLAGLASLEAAVRTALRALYATYPALARPQSDDEAFEIVSNRTVDGGSAVTLRCRWIVGYLSRRARAVASSSDHLALEQPCFTPPSHAF